MYINQPTGPRINTSTTHPNRGLIGHLEPLGADHGPLLGEIIICIIGIIKPMIRSIQAAIKFITVFNSLTSN